MNDYSQISSPPVSGRVAEKVKKYAPLMRVIEMHHRARKRRTLPKFHACIVSHAGEFSASVFSVIEYLTARVKDTVKNNPWRELSPKRAAAEFRGYAKDVIAIAMVKGYGAELRDVGYSLRAI